MNRAKAMAIVGSALLVVVVALAAVVAWKKVLSPRGITLFPGLTKTQPPSADVFPESSLPRFATYNLQQTSFTAALPDDPITLSELSNLRNFEQKDSPFTTSERNYLTENSFVIRPNTDQFYSLNPDDPTARNDDWTDLYQTIGGGYILNRAPENSVFITTDYLLHVYHRLVEKEVEYIEQTVFLEKLTQLSQQLFTKAVATRNKAGSAADRESFDRLTAYFAVPTAILETVQGDLQNQIVGDSVEDNITNAEKQLEILRPQMTDEAYQAALQELRLIFEHQKLAAPPLFAGPNQSEQLNLTEDYTQYTPRSHYAKNAMLRAYFRAMMWYGRTNFLAKSPSLTRDAIHITQLMQDPTLQKLWSDIYNPTAFFVGESDDLGILQYPQVITKAGITDQNITDRQLQNAQLLIGLLPKPKVMGSVIIDEQVPTMTKEELQNSTQGFRLFGQRFTPDAFIFTTLTQGQEAADPETGERLPSNTTALFVMSALGNKTADQFVPEWIVQNAPQSQRVLNNRLTKLKTAFEGLSTNDWTQNLYWSWLYSLESLFTDYQAMQGYPAFMRSPHWNVKSLQAALGSWTELKHDTLLYAKQSYAEMGAGGDDQTPPPVPKGYVEPNIPFFDRLLALSQMTQEGLQNSDALEQEFAGRHKTFEESVQFFRDIAVKQLANQPISDDEFEQLRTEGGSLDLILRPLPNEQSIEANARSAIIADVHTDVPDSLILYEATGIPNYVYVAVKDVNGTRLTKGLVYAHYEFSGPIGSRETDQTWQQKNYPPNNLPSSPFWVQSLTPR